MTSPSEAADLGRTEQRLVARFVPPLSPMEVRRCLDEAIAEFDDAPIRTFVVVLVERIATDRLRAAATRSGAVPASPSAATVAAEPVVERPIRVVA